MWYIYNIHPKLQEICIDVESYKSVFKMSTQNCIVYMCSSLIQPSKKDMYSITATKASVIVMGD